MSSRLLILGASVRAAAFSALRAGMVPHCTDLFADVDLRRCADARTVDSYPEGLLAAARESRAESWMYTGGLENYPHLIDQIAAECPLAGNRGDALRAVRNPHRLGRSPRPRLGRAADIPHFRRNPRRRFVARKAPCGEVAEQASASGTAPVDEPPRRRRPDAITSSESRAFPAPPSTLPRGARLYCSAQAVNWSAPSGRPRDNSTTPVRSVRCARPRLREQFEAIGRVLAREFGLVGLFGVDTVINGSKVYTIEVNPRYPASVEVLEPRSAFSAVELHLAACLGNDLPAAESPGELRHGHIRWGKCILCASRPHGQRSVCTVGRGCDAGGVNADLADIPPLGAAILAGRPITTVLAEAEDQASVLNALRQRVARIEQTMAAL